MKTPQEKYHNDPEYRAFVDYIHGFISAAKLTPSEVREAATLASIHYEMNAARKTSFVITTKAWEALKVLEDFTTSESGSRS